ncbi:MAG TPA: hydroxymethylbilane synthase [Gemmatimonadales bacterium]|nr:hydroxymethylbilane synthase [Gemmatimonadales bacterium]
MSAPHGVTVGSRASALALRQAATAVEALRRTHPALACRIEEFTTRGDRDLERPLPAIGGKGVFTEELEAALLAGRIDLAVHSLKDLPTAATPGLAVAAVLERADPRDVLVSRSRRPLAGLPAAPGVGTSSTRRAAQIAALRPDVRLLELRGNVPTRVRKALDPSGPYDAIVLAAAGLERLDLGDQIAERFAPERLLPAPGQGAIALECRAEGPVRDLVAALNHEATWAAVTAERAFLAGLEGGCAAPVAAFAALEGGALVLQGLVASVDGRRVLRFRRAGAPADAEALGRGMADEALGAGAAELVAP